MSDHLQLFPYVALKAGADRRRQPIRQSASARHGARSVDPTDAWPVLELGPGTGPVTAALIERGVAPERIVAVEFNLDFCALLVERYRGLNVVEGDAYDLATLCRQALAARSRRLSPACLC